MDEKIYTIYHIKDDLNLSISHTNLHGALVETSIDIYNICNNLLSELIPTNQNIFHYIYNVLNTIGDNHYNLILIYLDEIDNQSKNIKMICYIGILLIFLFLVFIYLFSINSFNEILKKKKNFIKVFYYID